jgi:signal transduction histidine kinase
VELVLRNLLMNSVEHHDQVTGRIGLAATVEPGWVNLTFTDDGPGIPQESERKAFQLFGTLKHEDKGQRSGLGLAVIKRTIESSGGSIALIPREGRGTAFEMRWPAVGRGTVHRSEPEARTASRGPVAVG